MQPLLNSAYIYRVEVLFTVDVLCNANPDLIRVNMINSCYLRPIMLRGYNDTGMNPKGAPSKVCVSFYVPGKYLGEDVCATTWLTA